MIFTLIFQDHRTNNTNNQSLNKSQAPNDGDKNNNNNAEAVIKIEPNNGQVHETTEKNALPSSPVLALENPGQEKHSEMNGSAKKEQAQREKNEVGNQISEKDEKSIKSRKKGAGANRKLEKSLNEGAMCYSCSEISNFSFHYSRTQPRSLVKAKFRGREC